VRIASRDKVDEMQEENDVVSLCSLYAGEETFGIDTRKIREVLGERTLQSVPMSPVFIAGVVPYRGEVLTAVNLRALLGMEAHSGDCCVLVMEDDEGAERFGARSSQIHARWRRERSGCSMELTRWRPV